MQLNDSRPPYIEFQRRAVEDRSKSLEAGVYMTKDVDFIIIVPHGSEGRTRIEQEYVLWLAKMKPLTGPKGSGFDGHHEINSRFAPDWVAKIQEAYEKWKKGEDMDVEGTPLKNWPAISPGQIRTCLDMHLQTIEGLAHAADDTVERIGMGGYTLRQRARDWLDSIANGPGKTGAELEQLRVENSDMKEKNQKLEAQMVGMQAQIDALQASMAEGSVRRTRGSIGA